MKYFLSILCLVCAVNLSFSSLLMANEQTTIKVGSPEVSLDSFTVELFVDSEKNATIEDVVSGKLSKEITSSRFSLPFQQANYWFSFTLHNESNKVINRVVIIDEPYLYNANLYYQDINDKWVVEYNGAGLPVLDRAIPSRLPHFLLSLQPGEKKKLYLMTATKHSLVSFATTIKTPFIAKQNEQLKIAGYWLFFGISLAMFFYNIFIYISLRDSLYLYYSLYCGAFFMFVMQYSGFHLFLVESTFIHYALASFVPLTLGLLTLFIGQLIQTKQNLPKIDLMIRFIVGIFFLEAVLTIINPSYYFITLLLGMPVTLFLFFVSLYAFTKKIPLANYLLFGMSWHVIGLFIITAFNLGLIEYGFFARYGFILGALIELMVFSLALVARVRLLQKEKNAFQIELLILEKKEKAALKIEVENKHQELLEIHTRMERLQRVDTLTGLFNRAYFDNKLIREWKLALKSEQPVAIILAEFRHLTLYHENYGEQTSDYSLRLLAQTIVSSAALDQVIVARLNDHRFALLIPGFNKMQTVSLIERIKIAVDKVKIPFRESPTGRVEMIFAGDAVVPHLHETGSQFLSKIKKRL